MNPVQVGIRESSKRFNMALGDAATVFGTLRLGQGANQRLGLGLQQDMTDAPLVAGFCRFKGTFYAPRVARWRDKIGLAKQVTSK
jgi:hypothetical protein